MNELRTTFVSLQPLIRFMLILQTCILSACSNVAERHSNADAIAQNAGMTKQTVQAGQFILTTYSILNNKNTDLLVVYIEGDGYAFQRKKHLSPDPTPKTPVALELAARDPGPSILYIGRPCQYLSTEQLKTCDPRYWSTHRYSEEVVLAIDSVINRFAANYHEIALVGYSGGGTVAALIATRHQNIKWLVTIAANLDHKAWTDLHQVSPLSGSLNAMDVAPQLKDITQRHYVGGKDDIVPVEIARSYINKSGTLENAEIIIKPDFDHQCCWVRDWTELLCNNGNAFIAYCN